MAPSMRIFLSTAAVASAIRTAVEDAAALEAEVSEYQLVQDANLGVEGYLDLCDSSIVEETCSGVFGKDPTTGKVEPEDVRSMLSGTKPSIDALWSALGLAADAPVSCSELCLSIVDTVKRTRVCPPASDIGCHILEDGSTICDTDVRPETIKRESRSPGDMPNLHDRPQLKRDNFAKRRVAQMPLQRKKAKTEEQLDASLHKQPFSDIDYPLKVAVRRAANLFRIFPAALVSINDPATQKEVQDTEDLWEGFEIDETLGGEESLGELSRNRTFSSSCSDSPKYAQHCPLWAARHECSHFVEGQRVADVCQRSCGTCPAQQQCEDQIRGCSVHQQRGNCAVSHYRYTYCAKTCGGCLPSAGGSVPHVHPHQPVSSEPSWKKKLREVNKKAEVYVDTALRRFMRHDTERAITKWYGRDAYNLRSPVRRKILNILNGVQAMLGNVEYVYPGPQCEANTYAYVYPDANYDCRSSELKSYACTTNSEKQFVFYMCELTMKSDLSVQIETLTHEGSHHSTSLTDDVDFPEQVHTRNGYEIVRSYGRNLCEQLAQKYPDEAVKNADNFCYYVQDVTDL